MRQAGVLALCLSIAILGWQIAGFVEYNFGDGEVRTMAFFFMGLLLALSEAVKVRDRARTSGTAAPQSVADR